MDEEALSRSLHIGELIERYIQGELTVPELDVLERWINENKYNRRVFEKMTNERYRKAALKQLQQYSSEGALESAKQRIRRQARTRRVRTMRLAAAATIALLFASTLLFLWRPRHSRSPATALVGQEEDVAPGGYRARLITSTGGTIVLGSMDSAFRQGGMLIRQHQGRLTYLQADAGQRTTQYNTLITPRGGTYQVVLDDGTKVWLNAASSIRYPVHFSGADRSVAVTGEVFFDVAPHPHRPFKVSVNGMQVEVLGTQFNIMAYDEEHTEQTTLVDGKIKVIQGNQSYMLQPGKMAEVNKGSGMVTVRDADVEEATAWKDGYFSFKQTDIKEIMRKFGRWYDITVQYEGDVPQKNYTGEVPMSMTLSEVLKVLRTGGAHFTISGRTLTVTP